MQLYNTRYYFTYCLSTVLFCRIFARVKSRFNTIIPRKYTICGEQLLLFTLLHRKYSRDIIFIIANILLHVQRFLNVEIKELSVLIANHSV